MSALAIVTNRAARQWRDCVGRQLLPQAPGHQAKALADGSFGRDGVFHAKQLQAKCASKYAPQQPGTPGNQMQAEPAKGVTQVQSGSTAASN